MKIIKKIQAFLKAKWNNFLDNREIKKLLVDIPLKDPNRVLYDVLLRNMQRQLREQYCVMPSQHSKQQKLFNYIQLKTAKKVVDNVMALQHVIGIQPMQGPVALVYKLQYNRDPASSNFQLSANATTQRIVLEVVKCTVEAQARKLAAAWTIEAMSDAKQMHNIDITEELITVLGQEIAHEIISEHINNFRKLANLNTAIKISSDQPNRKVSRLQALPVVINMAANDIARTTRRGAGNVIITSPTGLSLLQSCTNLNLRMVEGAGKSGNLDLMYVADIVSKNADASQPDYVMFKVMMSMFVLDDDANNTAKFLVAYKGSSAIDTGYVWAPYMITLPMGLVIDSMIFQPKMTWATRYGISTDDSTKNYFRMVEVDTNNIFDDVNVDLDSITTDSEPAA